MHGAGCPQPLRVVFLDIDGVLHAADTPGEPRRAEETEGQWFAAPGLFEPDCLRRLKRIVDRTQGVIVLSSSWRLEPEALAEAQARLGEWDLRIHGTTRRDCSLGVLSRAEEIALWLREHLAEVRAAVVLDDMDLSDALGAEHCVVVDGNAGLTDGDVLLAVDALERDGTAGAAIAAFEAYEAARAAGWRPWMKKSKKEHKEKKERKHKKHRRVEAMEEGCELPAADPGKGRKPRKHAAGTEEEGERGTPRGSDAKLDAGCRASLAAQGAPSWQTQPEGASELESAHGGGSHC